MIETNATDELKICEGLEKRQSDLITRMDRTFKYFRGDKFVIPEAEGKWESVTSNRAQAEGWKIINMLASGKLKISIAIDEANKEDRDKYSKTELLVNGMLYTTDRKLEGLPESPRIQSQKAFYIVVRGWTADRLLVLDDDDGNPYLDLAVWDRRNVLYIPGRDRLLKVYNKRFVSKEQLENEYKGFNGKVDEQGFVEVVDVWDCSDSDKPTEEAVIAGKEYVKEPVKVKIGTKYIDYLPIRIKAAGAIPLVNDDNDDNIAHVGEDYLVNNRDLLDTESRLLSYQVTAAGMEAKPYTIIYYDSTGGGKPPDFPKDPFIKNSVIYLDRAFKQEAAPPLPIQQGQKINTMLGLLQQKLNMGGLSSVAYGETDVAMTAFGTDILNKNTREHTWPFKLQMEQDYIWIASEIARQYKLGGYKESEMTGYNSKFKRFNNVKIKNKDVYDDKEFESKLIIDELSDRSAHSGMAIQEVKAGVSSLRTALDRHNLSEDPDHEIEIIEAEQFDKMLEMPLIKGMLAQIEDYAGSKKKDAAKAFILEFIWKKMQALQSQGQPETPPAGADQIVGKTPQLTAANAALTARKPMGNIPPAIREAAMKKG